MKFLWAFIICSGFFSLKILHVKDPVIFFIQFVKAPSGGVCRCSQLHSLRCERTSGVLR